ncbi:D-glycero-alpha-D-manno-heptose-1,7-bisphosphate 7-phosphatase [Desulfurobacterium sp.]
MQKAVFLDRDNTLIEDDGYIHEPEKVKLLSGVGEGLKLLKEAGFLLIVISNQSGIGRGYFKEEDFHAVNKKLNQLLERYNVQIDDFFFCPHKPDEGCSCRKPEIGLFLRAAEKWNINLKESFMIGDKISDVEAGNRAGCKESYLVKKGEFLKIAKLITGKR